MSLKLLVCLCIVQIIVINAEDTFDPYSRDIDNPSDLDFCNETVCTPPCPGAAPPKRCPINVPVCHFGCACHTDCNVGIVYCFETKDCMGPRRFFTKQRRVSKIE
ncbi:uncharacterized protein LOC118269866 isoform X2 [Spodoptera frugiperda]|uniref:Uncharacterized protein LOC118269866 isoform X2 n=1 Tax=Spodoptera frugiperda TaxID=7108 RepID=A0A9R0ECX0_SPOFR|nr:uncharacterized protein LOC118269866 isoform X2 [Spodoptera frugiperda]